MNPEWMVIWNAVMTIAGSIVAFFVRDFIEEQKRIEILLNKTREEYLKKTDAHTDFDRVISRLDRLESKLDRLMEHKQ
jgi:hypothetical protein